MSRKTKKPQPSSTEKLTQTGFNRGKKDWEAGIHEDPYLDDVVAYPNEEDRHLLAAGWGAGQDAKFKEASEEFDDLMRKHARN